eukprot:2955744-Pyramimonas_sp.AAC.1
MKNCPVVTDECFEFSVGLPQVPGPSEHTDSDPPVHFWGCWPGCTSDWPGTVFTDGSAIPSSIPE